MGDQEVVKLGHEPCPACGSSDNLARYSDGHGYCFGCGHYEPPDGEPQPTTRRNRTVNASLLSGETVAIPGRGLTQETCQRYGYQVGEAYGSPAHIAPYRNKSGEVVAQKIRYKADGKKAFRWAGDPKQAGLFGSQLLRDGGKRVYVTEGEIDAMAVSQALGNKWPVVSIPNGAGNARRDLAPWVSLLETYDNIVLCFDMDEPGREALEDCITLFAPGKVLQVILPDGFKDAGEMVVANKTADLVSALWNAAAYRPDGIRGVSDLKDAAMRPVEVGLPWPFPSLTAATYGVRRGELYGIGAGVGCGKTEFFKEVIAGCLKDGRKAGVLFLEEPPAHTLKVIAGKTVGRQFHIPGVSYPQEELSNAIDKLDGLLWVYDHFGAKGYDDVKARIAFLVQAVGCQDIFLDHLTALVAGEEDERRALDHIMADLAGMAQRLNFTLYFVSHLSTPDGKPHEEGGRVYERHFTGSRAIARWAHFLFALERDKQDPNGVTTFRVLKDRYTGRATGLTFGLGYDRETGTMFECELPRDDDSQFKDETRTNDEPFNAF